MSELYGAIEAGGTKFVCCVGAGPDDLRAEVRFPTEGPEETIGRAICLLKEQAKVQPLAAVGIASFGPLDLDQDSPTWGYITTPPKVGWAHTDLAGPIASAFGVPVAVDTDVNGAALGEGQWGAARGLDTFVYVTVGTGIGGGGVVRNQLMHGLVHPEMGHMRLPRNRDVDPFEGCCPFHGDCLEGIASGPAIEARWGRPAAELPPDHPAWALEAEYLALACVNLTVVLSPQRIILGGGVMLQHQLFPEIRRRLQERLAGYIGSPAILDRVDSYIVPPGLGDRAGVLGALALATRSRTGVSRGAARRP